MAKLQQKNADSQKLREQLDSRVQDLQKEQQGEVARLTRKAEAEKAQVESALKRKADHLKYFHEQIM